MVIWLTGLSGSGKTTLCQALYHQLKPHLPQLVVLDGDLVRSALNHDLGYTEADRMVQVKRIQGLAKCLSDQGLVVLVAVLYSHPDLLVWNRQHFTEYVEIYLEASLDALRRRDTKGLYAKALSVQMKDVVGVDIPWRPPTAPDLVIQNDDPEPPEELARKVISRIPQFARLLQVA